MGVPQNRWFVMENLKIMMTGGTPICGNISAIAVWKTWILNILLMYASQSMSIASPPKKKLNSVCLQDGNLIMCLTYISPRSMFWIIENQAVSRPLGIGDLRPLPARHRKHSKGQRWQSGQAQFLDSVSRSKRVIMTWETSGTNRDDFFLFQLPEDFFCP